MKLRWLRLASLNGVSYRIVPLPQSKYAVKATYAMTPKGLTIHNTYNDATATNEIAYMHRNNNYTSYHLAVDDKEVLQGVPFNRSTWHAGDGKNGYGNRNHIALEVCYSKSGGERYRKAEDNAVKVAAQILKNYNWPITKMKKHQDWSGKWCPHRVLDEKRWASFVKKVANELDRLNGKQKGDLLTVGQYKELKALIEAQAKEIKKLKEGNTSQQPSSILEKEWQFGVEQQLTDGRNPHQAASRQHVMAFIARYDKHALTITPTAKKDLQKLFDRLHEQGKFTTHHQVSEKSNTEVLSLLVSALKRFTDSEE